MVLNAFLTKHNNPTWKLNKILSKDRNHANIKNRMPDITSAGENLLQHDSQVAKITHRVGRPQFRGARLRPNGVKHRRQTGLKWPRVVIGVFANAEMVRSHVVLP